jgi:branched-chain amino acid aminotransferase
MAQPLPGYAFFRGKIVPFSEANVSVMTHALNYGTGCFEGIRAYWNAAEEQLLVFRMREHFERLQHSMSILLMETPYTVDDLGRTTVDLLRREGYRQDTYIRPLAFKADEVVGVKLHGLRDELTIFAVPFGKYVSDEENTKVHISSWRRISDNAIPARAKITGAYINSAFAKSEAQLNGYDEAIVLNENGHISEGSAENLFMIRNGQLITPPVTENILEGITRATMMELSRRELGCEVIERSIDRTELYIADEIFLVGTGCQVAAVTSIDQRPVGNGKMGPIVAALRDLYFKAVRGQLPQYRHWCTPVYPVGQNVEHAQSEPASRPAGAPMALLPKVHSASD